MVFFMLTEPYLSDLRPIEHICDKLKDRIYMLYPDLESFDVIKEQLKRLFYKAIEKAWKCLGDVCFNPLIRSIETRVNTSLEA